MATEQKVSHTFEVSRAKVNGKPVDTKSLTIHYDFTGVTPSQLMAIALRQLTVQLQGQMRGMVTRKEKPVAWPAAVATFNGKSIKVSDILSNGRAKLTPQERAAKLVKNISEADRAALVAMLAKSSPRK